MLTVACFIVVGALGPLAQGLTGGGDELSSPTSDRQNSPLQEITADRSGELQDSCLDRLHKDIENFQKFMQLTKKERQYKEEVVRRLNDTILALWPTAEIKVFGSYYTGLGLPTSDIDLFVIGNFTKSSVYILEEAVVNAKISKHEQNIIIPYVRVTGSAFRLLIKNQMCHINLDISFNGNHKSSDLAKKYCERFPMLAKLVIVLKQLLLKHGLNSGFNGGIVSFGLLMMTTAFLELHPKRSEDTFNEENLGRLLIDFLDLYGRKFDYENTAIRVKDGGAFLPKVEIEKNLKSKTCGKLCIEDPVEEVMNITSNTTRVDEIKQVFGHAYLKLREAIQSENCTENSILEHIVQVPDDVISYRNWVRSGGCNTRPPPSSCVLRFKDIVESLDSLCHTPVSFVLNI